MSLKEKLATAQLMKTIGLLQALPSTLALHFGRQRLQEGQEKPQPS